MYWRYYVGLARRGVMVHSPTHDAVYEDGYWKRGYDKYCAKLNARLIDAGSRHPAVPIPEFEHGELGIEEMRQLMRLQVPFVVRDGARDLPLRAWSLDYLDRIAGDCGVPINEAEDRASADLDRPTKAHHYYDFRTGTLAEVTASIRRGGKMRITTAEDVMHHNGGRLRRDLDLPYFEQITGWARNENHWLRSRLSIGRIVGAQLLVQPDNAFTLWHAEPGDNFFVLAQGRKTWTMAHSYYTAAMRPRVKATTNYHGSSIDVREADQVQVRRGFAGYLHVPKVRLEMGPGDILRVPNHWWHTVETHAGHYTIAVSIRAVGSPNLTCPGYTRLRTMDRQFHELARAFERDGRITDQHIGYPRKSRAAERETG